jgi:outer membrane protein assembly factor BamB
MRTGQNRVHQLLVWCALSALLGLLGGCGGRTAASTISPGGVEPATSAGIDLAQALSELDALATPAGVEPKLFATLKASLRAMLLQRGTAKLVSTPPDTQASKVDDLTALRYASSATFTFTYRNAGDYNQDGIVNTTDVVNLALYFSVDNTAPGWKQAQVADGNNNGKVELGDLIVIAANFGKQVLGYRLWYSVDGTAYSIIANLAWNTSSIPADEARRVFAQLLEQPEAGLYHVTPYDSTGDGVASDVYIFPSTGLPLGGWPVYGGDMQHTRRSQYVGPQTGALAWDKWLADSASTAQLSFTEATVGPDGTVYVGLGQDILALGSTGALRWRYVTGKELLSRPAASADGTVYASSDKLYAFNPDGTLKWSCPAERTASAPATGADGAVYVGSANEVLALNPDGTLRWSYTTPAPSAFEPPADPPSKGPPPPPPPDYETLLSTMAIGPEGSVYVQCWDGNLYALNPNGTLKWTYKNDWSIRYTPMLGADGTLYAGCSPTKLCAINPDGSLKWQSAEDFSVEGMATGSDGWVYVGNGNSLYAVQPDGTLGWYYQSSTYISQPALGPGGRIFVGADGNLCEVEAGLGTPYGYGNLLWSFPTGSTLTPAIGLDGTLYQGGGGHRFYALNPDGTLKWSYLERQPSSSPAVNAGGTAYIGSAGGYVYAVDNTGDTQLRSHMAGAMTSSPALAVDGTVYLGSLDGQLYAFNADLTLKWSYATGAAIESSPAVGFDGTVFAGSNDQQLYALRPDGTLKWRFTTQGAILSSPALGMDGAVYAGSRDRKLYAINADGTLRWSYLAGEQIESSPALGADGTVFFASNDNLLTAVTADGALKWSYPADGRCNPALGNDGTIYCISSDNLIALTPAGELRWSCAVGQTDAVTSPAIGADGLIYTGGGNDKIFAVNADGVVAWSYQTSHGIASSPALDADGTVYIGGMNGRLYAFRD